MRTEQFTRGDVRLEAVVWDGPGDGAPAFLLLHGLSSNSHFWTRVATRLTGDTVIALDQRAHGASSAPAHGYSVAEVAADAAFVLESLDLRRVVVVGHSWGGTIALHLAAERPDLVSGLAALDSPIQSFAARMSWEQAQAMMQPPLPVYGSLAAAIEPHKRFLGHVWDSDLDAAYAHGLLAVSGGWRLPLTAEIRFQILEAMFFQDYQALWERVRVPVYLGLARGAGTGPFYEAKVEGARNLAAVVEDLEVDWFDTGHDIPLEDPDGVVAGLRRLAGRTRAE